MLSRDINKDADIFGYFSWLSTEVNRQMSGSRPLVVAFQPPWILSTQDIKEFSECGSVSATTSH